MFEIKYSPVEDTEMARKPGQRHNIHGFRSSSSSPTSTEHWWGAVPCREEAAREHKFAAPLRGRPGRGGREKEEEAGERWGRGKPIRLGPV